MDANGTFMEPDIGTEYHDYGENAQLLSFKCISKSISVQKYKFIQRLEWAIILNDVTLSIFFTTSSILMPFDLGYSISGL